MELSADSITEFMLFLPDYLVFILSLGVSEADGTDSYDGCFEYYASFPSIIVLLRYDYLRLKGFNRF